MFRGEAGCRTTRVIVAAGATWPPRLRVRPAAQRVASRRAHWRQRNERKTGHLASRRGTPYSEFLEECRREDLNLHGVSSHQVLNLARLPIPPLRLFC